MRKTKRAPLTLRACEMIAAKLANHGDPDAVLDKSTASSWSDVYPESVLPGASAKLGKPFRHANLDQVDHEEGISLTSKVTTVSPGVVNEPVRAIHHRQSPRCLR